MTACFHVQYHLNGGTAVGQSIPATEHSVMTSFDEEFVAIENLINQYPGQIVACVMDSYNYDYALEVLLPRVKPLIEKGTGVFVIRPDSGDPVVQVLKALRAALKADFKHTKNKKKYIVFDHVAVIQGDGIDYGVVKDILSAVELSGFSAENVAFGMGGGLLQKVNRDTLSFATKLSYVKFSDDKERNVMKAPFGVEAKHSLPGLMRVMRKTNDGTSHHTVFTQEKSAEARGENYSDSMITVFDNGKINEAYMSETFDVIRQRVSDEWNRCHQAFHDGTNWKSPLDASITKKQVEVAAEINLKNGDYKSKPELFNTGVEIIKVTEAIKRREIFKADLNKIQQRHKQELNSLNISKRADDSIQLAKETSANIAQMTATLANRAAGTTSKYEESELEYPLLRLNNLLDSLSSKLDNK
jgi:hypothetical protein